MDAPEVDVEEPEKVYKLKLSAAQPPVVLEIGEKCVKKSETLFRMISDLDLPSGGVLPVEKVDEKSMKAIIDYFKEHPDDAPTDPKKKIELTDWDKAFFGGLSPQERQNALLAADFLGVEIFSNALCRFMVETLEQREIQDIPAMLGIQDGQDRQEQQP